MKPGDLSLSGAELARIAVVDRLAALGDRSIDALVTMLSDPSWAVRRAVTSALAALGDGAAVALARLLRTQRGNETAVAAAVDALATSVGDAATSEALAMLGDRAPAVAADGAAILGRRRALEASDALAAAVSHRDDNVAVAAIEALGALDSSAAVDPLLAALRQGSFFRTLAAMQVLAATSDPRTLQPLAGLLDTPAYRADAARALGRTGSVRAIAPLVAFLDTDITLVALALADLVARAEWTGAIDHVLQTLETQVGPSAARFGDALPDAAPTEQAALAMVLGRIGGSDAMPALLRYASDRQLGPIVLDAIKRIARRDPAAEVVALRDGDATVRTAVLPAARTRQAATQIVALLDDEDAEVRARACEALARIGDTTAVPALFARLAEPNQRVALAAAGAINSLNTADTPARVVDALRMGSPAVRRNALRIVAFLGSAAAFEATRAAVEDADRRIAEMAIMALAGIDDPRVDPTLTGLAGSLDPTVRAVAMRAVAQRGADGAAALLERALNDDAPWVRYYASQGLGRLRVAAAAPALIEHLSDPAPQVRIAAVEALAQLESVAAWDALARASRSLDDDERRAALASIGHHDRADALALLLEATGARSLPTRLIALAGLANQSHADAIAALDAAARDPAPEIRDTAVSLLADRDAPAAAMALIELAMAAPFDHPAHAALSRPGPALGQRIASILSALDDTDDRGAAVLTAALARAGTPAATGALFAAMHSQNPVARRAAATTVIAIDAEGARGAISRLASDDPDPNVRRVAAALDVE